MRPPIKTSLNCISQQKELKTMSSVEIAELTGKRHDNVIRAAIKLTEKGIINAPQIEERYNKNNFRVVYELNKTESLNLVANLSPEFTAKIIERWQELEEIAPKLPQTLPEALRFAANLAEENQILIPKANALDRLSDASGTHSLRDSAKQLGIKPKRFYAWLDANGWCFKNVKDERIPYQTRIDSGLMTARSGEANGHSYVQPMITAKGLVKLAEDHSGGA